MSRPPLTNGQLTRRLAVLMVVSLTTIGALTVWMAYIGLHK